MGDVGLPRATRLRRAADFLAMRDAPGRLTGRYVLIRYATAAGASARMGMAVSRRVSKRAVVRNRIKRQMRESFRRMRAKLPPLDLLLIARSEAATVDNAILRAELDRLWPRLQSLKPLPPTGTISD
ncbi:MAG: ribonuclease P protein component [Xanthomonadaceae bacterium]|nr:ribonuclease P protein component [Xanthomonadaceae bacterium]